MMEEQAGRRWRIGTGIALIVLGLSSCIMVVSPEQPTRDSLRLVSGTLAAPVDLSSLESAVLTLSTDRGTKEEAVLRNRTLLKIDAELASFRTGDRVTLGLAQYDGKPYVMELSRFDRRIVTFDQALLAHKQAMGGGVILAQIPAVLGLILLAWPWIVRPWAFVRRVIEYRREQRSLAFLQRERELLQKQRERKELGGPSAGDL